MHQKLKTIQTQLNNILLGKPEQVEMAMVCLLAKGHLLIEDLPGMGKTTLAHALAKVFGLDFQRVQFTSDLLPADITGASVYDRNKEAFVFHKGPVFSQLVLADEINRATPKTQSALLEAMEEKQVTIEGKTYELPVPFFVIATQNPSHQVGTYPLPESQLDRFLVRLSLGYPAAEVEHDLLMSGGKRQVVDSTQTSLSNTDLRELQKSAEAVTVSDKLVEYLLALVLESRQSPDLVHGLSPRAGLALVDACKAYAFLQQQSFVTPEVVQKVFPFVVTHRLQTNSQASFNATEVADQIIQKVAIPL